MIQKKGKRKNSAIYHIDLPQDFADVEKYFFRYSFNKRTI